MDLDLKKLMIIPVLMLVLGTYIVFTNAQADTIPRSIELKGGTLISLKVSQEIPGLEKELNDRFGLDAQVRMVRDGLGNVVQEDIEISKVWDASSDRDVAELKELKAFLIGKGIPEADINIDSIGPALSEMFMHQAIKAILFAFTFMAIVVFLRFRTFIPAFAVVLSAFSDIVVTLAVMIVLNIQVSLASFVALLLLLGYSVDTDILLTTRLLKRKGDVDEKIRGSMVTGLTMSGTTMTAVIVLYIVSTSRILDEIAMVLMIGMVVDVINTWIQNAYILKWYVEGKKK